MRHSRPGSHKSRTVTGGLVFMLWLLVACSGTAARPVAPTHPPLDPTYAAQLAALRDPAVPELPFADNPDPSQCGIPSRWGQDDPAWLTGLYEGRMIQDEVLLYDSHLRLKITASAPHGSQVQVLLFQQNPVIDYYLVKIVGAGPPNEGWVPAPFLSFEPVEAAPGQE
jgi:hypothetical protein